MSRGRLLILPALLAMVLTTATKGLATADPSGPRFAMGTLPPRPVTGSMGPETSTRPGSQAGAVTAVVVRSWGGCTSDSLIWSDLNASWSSYGTIPISIDYTDQALCAPDGTITLAKLEASGADVVILSDPAGGLHQLSASEVDALHQYAPQGHDVIGTYVVFQWRDTDNRALAPLFGIQPGTTFVARQQVPVTPTFEEKYPSSPLFRGVGNPYASSGYPDSQTPTDREWTAEELLDGKYVAMASERMARIVVRQAPTYVTIYISTMPEYVGSTIDEQFFYNAITYPATGV